MNWMRRDDTPTVVSKRARQVLISVFALVALALGMFVMTSMSGQHSITSATQSQESEHHLQAASIRIAQDGPAGAVVSAVTKAPSEPSTQCDSTCELGCAFSGAACVLAVVAFGVALFALSRNLSFLALVARPIAALRTLAARSFVPQPSLVALSICRT